MATPAQELHKKLKIQTGAAKRNHKEYLSYLVEVEKRQEKVKTMKENNDDPYSIRKQEEVLQDSVQMVPDAKKRVQKSYKDLVKLIQNIEDTPEAAQVTTTEDWTAAKEVVDTLSQAFAQ